MGQVNILRRSYLPSGRPSESAPVRSFHSSHQIRDAAITSEAVVARGLAPLLRRRRNDEP